MEDTTGVPRPRRRLGEILVGTGLISRDDLTRALEEQFESGGVDKLGDLLMRRGRLGPSSLMWALAFQQGTQGPVDLQIV